MAALLGPQNTSFTLDTMGRFLCNTLPEATDSVNEVLHGHNHPFDILSSVEGHSGAFLRSDCLRSTRRTAAEFLS